MNVNKNPFGGIFRLPSFRDFRQWFRGKFGYFSRGEEIQHEYLPIPQRDPPFPPLLPPIITPPYFNRINFAQYEGDDKMLKLKGVIGGISLEKIHEGAKGVSYRLGVLRDRISQKVLSSLQSLPKEYEEWYPGKEKEIEKARRSRDENEVKTILYTRRL